MREEILLPLHDGGGHAQDGVKALLDVLDEPARLLQALLQRLVALAPAVAVRSRVAALLGSALQGSGPRERAILTAAAESLAALGDVSIATPAGAVPMMRPERSDTTVTASLPALRRYALAPDRGRWFWGADEFAPSGADTPDPATPPELSAYCGHYRCYSPWFTNFRVVLRGDRLMLIAPGGVEAPGVDTELVPLGPNIFRIGADERVPERVIFGPPIHGAAPWADRDGCRYSRAFTD